MVVPWGARRGHYAGPLGVIMLVPWGSLCWSPGGHYAGPLGVIMLVPWGAGRGHYAGPLGVHLEDCMVEITGHISTNQQTY